MSNSGRNSKELAQDRASITKTRQSTDATAQSADQPKSSDSGSGPSLSIYDVRFPANICQHESPFFTRYHSPYPGRGGGAIVVPTEKPVAKVSPRPKISLRTEEAEDSPQLDVDAKKQQQKEQKVLRKLILAVADPDSSSSRDKVSISEVKMIKREAKNRVFVNRSLYLEKIKFFGFDMDYTLAVYQSPLYESMTFDLLLERMVAIGYPTAIKEYKYDPSFPVRGLWFDSTYGTLLKMDPYGNILVTMKGFNVLNAADMLQLYPNKFLQFDDHRIYIMNTLFDLPQSYLLACLVNYFTESPEYSTHAEMTGVNCGELYMSYKSIFQDVRDAVDFVHMNGKLKEMTLARMPELVIKDARLPVLLDRLRSHGGAKTFLLTNSKYNFTDRIMRYLLADDQEEKREWWSYFDYILIDANKPRFFGEGSTLREIDPATSEQKIGVHTGPLRTGHIYSGGTCDVFSALIGAKGRDVLYCGDHIYGDILKSKKIRGWRTFLVVPEMTHELYVWSARHDLQQRLQALEARLNDAYLHMDLTSTTAPDTRDIQDNIQKITHEIDLEFGIFGSLFRSGSRQTFFASQIIRFADLYASTVLNLLHYPFCYLFKAPPMLMPHESTITEPEEIKFEDDETRVVQQLKARSRSLPGEPAAPLRSPKSLSLVAETPTRITHHHDDDEDDDANTAAAGTVVA